MRPRFDFGAAVRVTRNIHNDGTFPGATKGTLLVRRSRMGFVRDVHYHVRFTGRTFQVPETALRPCETQEIAT
jgi:hypothetical protein